MAVGSNTVGLLFKIGVDVKDVKDAFSGGVLDGMKQGFKDVEQEAKRLSSAANDVGTSLKPLIQTGNQLNTAFHGFESGNIGQGMVSLTRALGPAAIAVGAVAIAAVAAAKAFEGMLETASQVGMESKEDFDELQKSLAAVGLQLTEADHALAQGLLKSLDEVKASVTAIFVQILREAGPALIVFLREVAKLLQDLGPLITVLGKGLTELFVQLAAFVRDVGGFLAVFHDSWTQAFSLDLNELHKGNLDVVRKELEAVRTEFAKGTGTFKAPSVSKAGLKDLTDAQLEQNRAERELAAQRVESEEAFREIEEQRKKGEITFEEASKRRLDVLKVIHDAEKDALDAEEDRIRQSTLLENQKTDALEAVETKRRELRQREANEQEEERRKQADFIEKTKQHMLEFAEFLFERNEAIIRELARQGREIPGGGKGIPGLPDPDEVQGQLDAIHESFGGFFDFLQKGLENSGAVFKDWGSLVMGVLQSFIRAMEDSFAAFILTGQFGAIAFKRMVAQIIAALAIESAVKAVFEFAEAFAASARGDVVSFWLHTKAANLYLATALIAGAAGLAIGAAGGLGGGTSGAAAGAGGFGGTSATPSPVTINQGAAVTTLGIAAQQVALQTDIRNSLQNITTAPPGDVLQRGVDQNPLAVGHGNNEAARRDGTVSRQFLEIAGLRPA